jgi:hypothetical protein
MTVARGFRMELLEGDIAHREWALQVWWQQWLF